MLGLGCRFEAGTRDVFRVIGHYMPIAAGIGALNAAPQLRRIVSHLIVSEP
jgi:hypothetical protein